MPPEEDLNNWGHHRSYNSVDDEVMQRAVKGTDLVCSELCELKTPSDYNYNIC
jgi:hypothetical protein